MYATNVSHMSPIFVIENLKKVESNVCPVVQLADSGMIVPPIDDFEYFGYLLQVILGVVSPDSWEEDMCVKGRMR